MSRSPLHFAFAFVFTIAASICTAALGDGEMKLADLTAPKLRDVVSKYLQSENNEKPALGLLGVTLDPKQITYQPAGAAFGTLHWMVFPQRELDDAKQQEVVDLVIRVIANALGQADPPLSTEDHKSIFDEQLKLNNPDAIVVEIVQPSPPKPTEPAPEQTPPSSNGGNNNVPPGPVAIQAPMLAPTVDLGGCPPGCGAICRAPAYCVPSCCVPACCGRRCRHACRHHCRHSHCHPVICGSGCCTGPCVASATTSETLASATSAETAAQATPSETEIVTSMMPTEIATIRTFAVRLGRLDLNIAPWKPSDEQAEWPSAKLSTVAYRPAGEAVAADPQTAALRFGAAYHAYWRGEYTAAIHRAEEGLAADAADPRLWYYKGLAEYALGLEPGYSQSFSKATYYRVSATPEMQAATRRALIRVQGQLRLEVEAAAKKAASEGCGEAQNSSSVAIANRD